MAIYFPETEDIYFKKTKTYFQEVISSYSNGNYRSAIVMLYSVAVCDILFKLQELKDMFNDSVAEEILREVDKSRNEHDNKSKSKWEKEFIDNVYRKTKLLDLEAYTNLNHLYDHRNFSAHPALNENYELIAPSKETTIANIKNILKDILIKPPIFIKNITDTLTEDLKGKNNLYENEEDKLSTYLNNKYFSKMPQSMKLAVLKAFWKFCFSLPDNEECMNNLAINRKALEILIDGMRRETIEYIKENNQLFAVAQDESCVMNLIIFLSKYTLIYNELNEDTKLQIDAMIEKDSRAKAIAWFKYISPDSHFGYLKTITNLSLEPNAIKRMITYYTDIGEREALVDFWVWYYGESYNFNAADARFELVIEPYLNMMTASHFKAIIESTNINRQIWDRALAYSANNKIMQIARKVLDNKFEYKKYPHFRFDEKIIQPDTSIGKPKEEDDLDWEI